MHFFYIASCHYQLLKHKLNELALQYVVAGRGREQDSHVLHAAGSGLSCSLVGHAGCVSFNTTYLLTSLTLH